MINVAFGTTILNRGLLHNAVDGIGNYTRELHGALRGNSELNILTYAYDSKRYNADIHPGHFKSRALASYLLRQPFFRDFERQPIQPDLIHATDHLVPCNKNIPIIATLMDAIPLENPDWVNYRLKWIKNSLWKETFEWASRVITISEYSKSQITRLFGINENCIDVIPLGVNDRWFKTPTQDALDRVREKYKLPKRYFLFVGTLQPRKNLFNLIAAHEALPRDVQNEFPLIVIGRPGWACEKEVEKLSQDSPTIKWLRYIPDDDIVTVVSGAHALAIPSLCEGFGLPVLEAFAAKTLVLSSNTGALPEVVGDAGILFNPENVTEISNSMLQATNHTTQIERIVTDANERAKSYTWERTAEMTFSAYKKIS